MTKMTIDKEQISSADFIRNEVKTLGFIREQPSIESSFPELCAEAGTVFNLCKGKLKNSNLNSFTFGCELRLEIEEEMRSLFIEANVLQNYSEATYALSMCDSEADDKKLIRKFHFDYDPQITSSVTKKPKYHLQFGGKATPKLKDNNISAERLQDWLSVPRLSITPINLALLLDKVFMEFSSEATEKVIQKREWRDMVKDNEDQILVPYFTNVSRFITGGHKSTHLIRDFVYGN